METSAGNRLRCVAAASDDIPVADGLQISAKCSSLPPDHSAVFVSPRIPANPARSKFVDANFHPSIGKISRFNNFNFTGIWDSRQRSEMGSRGEGKKGSSLKEKETRVSVFLLGNSLKEKWKRKNLGFFLGFRVWGFRLLLFIYACARFNLKVEVVSLCGLTAHDPP
ncbi:ABC transporter G family member 10 [Corchorus olitorius]|uniref:ABC transporter G family member 10 n=1 Tax=Corchorus olitorius TaxID=93759 RepID=A0A1R3FZ75_9ROSI|nr:ABC transporter G family member 10 [Corchorus olitorius]